MQIDSPKGETTRGTSQAGNLSGDWVGFIDKYAELNVEMIDQYAQIAPVELIVMPGNHDRDTTLFMGSLLKIMYKRQQIGHGVTVKTPEFRWYARYGRVVLAFAHGDNIPTSKSRQEGTLQKMLLDEANQAGVRLDNSVAKYFLTGHLHHEIINDYGGFVHLGLASLTPPDRWSKSKGFIGSMRRSPMYIVEPKYGIRETFYAS